MGTSSLNQENTTSRPPEKPCWRDILWSAFGGYYITDQQLENMLDHLERTS